MDKRLSKNSLLHNINPQETKPTSDIIGDRSIGSKPERSLTMKNADLRFLRRRMFGFELAYRKSWKFDENTRRALHKAIRAKDIIQSKYSFEEFCEAVRTIEREISEYQLSQIPDQKQKQKPKKTRKTERRKLRQELNALF